MKSKNTSIKKYADEILTTLQKHQSFYRPETFHKLRVDIKIIHAYWKMLEYCCDTFSCKKHFKPFVIAFKNAGKVREIDIEVKSILFYEKADKTRNLISYLNELKKIRKDIFFAGLTQNSFNDIKLMLRNRNLKRMDNKSFKQYFLFKRKQITKLCKQNKTTVNQYHKLRKILKEFYYNFCFVYPKQHTSFTKDLLNLSKLLGEWHDVLDVKTHITKIINKNLIFESELTTVKHILIKTAEAETKLLSSIDVMRRELYKNHSKKSHLS